jgi:hypothetical protein
VIMTASEWSPREMRGSDIQICAEDLLFRS